MYSTITSGANLQSQINVQLGNLRVPQIALLVFLPTLCGISADQFAVPALYSSSPLWAVAGCFLLVWRRGGFAFERRAGREADSFELSAVRIALFAAAHIALACAAHFLQGTFEQFANSSSILGWLTAALKISVLLPTVLLLPFSRWRVLARIYAAEGIAALVVLFTFFPMRIFASVWPWYGQILGRFVLAFTQLFVPGLSYTSALTPTIHGPTLDVTILFSCSGAGGVELFDYLFAFVAFADWNRLRKGRTLAAYFLGIAAMIFGNALRISAFVVFGNRGFADEVASFHLTAGSLFFAFLFLAYLALIYRSLLAAPRGITAPPWTQSPQLSSAAAKETAQEVG